MEIEISKILDRVKTLNINIMEARGGRCRDGSCVRLSIMVSNGH